MKQLYILKKWVFSIMLIICFIIFAKLIKLLVINEDKKRYYLTKGFTCYSKLFLKICSLKLHKKNINIPRDKGALIVANHMGFMDAFCISATIPVVFVSTMEVYERPFVGILFRNNGSTFIERRNIKNINKELQEITDLLKRNFKVMLFPEGDSTDGMKILPFKSPFFQAAIDAKADVIPLCLIYKSIDGEPFNDKTKDIICYYGDMYFKKQIRKVYRAKHINAILKQVDCIHCDNNMIREDIAEYTRNKILEEYKKHINIK